MKITDLHEAIKKQDGSIKQRELDSFIAFVGGSNLIKKGLPSIGVAAKSFVRIAPLLDQDVVQTTVSLERMQYIAELIDTLDTGENTIRNKWLIRKAPLYWAICQLTMTEKLSERYALLVAQLAMANNSIEANSLDLSGPLYRACKAAMKLANINSALIYFPDHEVATELFANTLKEISNRFDSSIKYQISGISYLLQKALIKLQDGTKRPRRSVFQKMPGAKLKQPHITSEFDSKVDGIHLPKVDCLRMATVDEKEAKQAENNGAYANEVTSINVLTTTSFKETDPMEGRSISDHIRRSQGALHGIAMGNQLLPTQWGNLNPLEVAQLLSDIGEVFNRKKRLQKKVSNQEGAVLLAMMFWFGIDEGRASSVRLVSEPKNLDCELAYCISNHQWFVSAINVKYKTEIEEIAKRDARPLTDYLVLNVPDMVAGMVSRWVKEVKAKPGDGLWESSPTALKKWIEKFIRWHNKRHHGRMCKSRISGYLFKEICHGHGDVVDASMVVGRVHYLADTMLYYTARSTQALRKIYSAVCAEIETTWQSEIDQKVKIMPCERGLFSDQFDEKTERYIGSRYCPLEQSLQRFIRAMKGRLRHEKKKYSKHRNSILALHEIYTTYTAQMLLFASGYRAVRSPMRCSFELDWESGLLCINDKDYEDGYNSRIVWLPGICIDQLKCYQNHINNMASYLLHLEREVFDSIKIQNELLLCGIFPDKKKEKVYQKKAKQGKKVKPPKVSYRQWLPFLFFLTAQGWQGVRPETLKPVVSTWFHLPLNANRHYMRSKLREAGCSPEIPRIVLGHWEAGQEPWSAYSGADPVYFMQELQRVWEPLFCDLGWEVIHGVE